MKKGRIRFQSLFVFQRFCIIKAKAEPPQWMASASVPLTATLVVEKVNTGQWDYSYGTDPEINDLMRAADAVR